MKPPLMWTCSSNEPVPLDPRVDIRQWVICDPLTGRTIPTGVGTAFTNFTRDEFHKYMTALMAHGNPDFVIVDHAIDSTGCTVDMYSVHNLAKYKNPGESAHSFLATYRRLFPNK